MIRLVAAACAALAILSGGGEARAQGGAPTPLAIDVAVADGQYVVDPLVPNARDAAPANTQRIHAILQAAPAGAAVRFPRGEYYFDGAALPNRGTLETSAPGQVLYGDGADVTRLIQLNRAPHFGFQPDTRRKDVPTATVRIRHSACRLRDLTVMVDPEAPVGTVLPSAAVQLAHIAYFPDHNVGIIETTGQGADFLVDNVVVERVHVGLQLGSGIMGARFFEFGIDIIGSGGMCKVRNIERLDARCGVRLDNGNHCGQGDYTFESLYMIGRPGVTDGGVFFDWIGGQLPMVANCEAGFTSMFHAGPLGIDGSRLEPFPEGEVHRSSDRDWDWLTWHGHTVVAEPDEAQRREWYGLPRHASVVRIGSEPRTGGTEWKEGEHYRVERVAGAGPFDQATRVHWLHGAPPPGTTYYVTFEQPKEYRVHDLEWGYVKGCFFGEAAQGQGYVFRFEDQGFGTENPDFRFPVGYGFIIEANTAINGDALLQGAVGSIRFTNNVMGVFNLRIEGLDDNRRATEVYLDGNTLNGLTIGDYVSHIAVRNCRLGDALRVTARHESPHITLSGNTITAGAGPALALQGPGVRNVRVTGNTVWCPTGPAVLLEGVTLGLVSANDVTNCPGTGLELRSCRDILVLSNILSGNGAGLCVTGPGGPQRIRVRDNLIEGSQGSSIVTDAGVKAPEEWDNLLPEGVDTPAPAPGG